MGEQKDVRRNFKQSKGPKGQTDCNFKSDFSLPQRALHASFHSNVITKCSLIHKVSMDYPI